MLDMVDLPIPYAIPSASLHSHKALQHCSCEEGRGLAYHVHCCGLYCVFGALEKMVPGDAFALAFSLQRAALFPHALLLTGSYF